MQRPKITYRPSLLPEVTEERLSLLMTGGRSEMKLWIGISPVWTKPFAATLIAFLMACGRLV